jgi:hypothetical protein
LVRVAVSNGVAGSTPEKAVMPAPHFWAADNCQVVLAGSAAGSVTTW